MESSSSYFSRALQGCIAMLPLSLAVVPWGFLAGSFAIDSGLTPMEGQAMSAILFAGAAQLVAMGMIKSGATLLTMVVTIFFITSRHFLYSLSMRNHIVGLPLRWRLALVFYLPMSYLHSAVTINQRSLIAGMHSVRVSPSISFGTLRLWLVSSLVRRSLTYSSSGLSLR